ncbi:hypothetical protein Tco_0581468 [Tanacetum coccineum]
MDTAYGRRCIRRIGNCEYAFSCEDLALIRRISFPGYGVLVRICRIPKMELHFILSSRPAFTTHNLAHKGNMEDHTKQIPWEFLVLILLVSYKQKGRYGVSVPALHKKPRRIKDLYAEMDDPDITMEEYIRLEKEKARRRGQTFNWETPTYGKVRYREDIDYLKDFKIDFPAIVYEDALTPEPEVSLKPTVSPLNDNKFDFRISFDESDDEDYVVMYDKIRFLIK